MKFNKTLSLILAMLFIFMTCVCTVSAQGAAVCELSYSDGTPSARYESINAAMNYLRDNYNATADIRKKGVTLKILVPEVTETQGCPGMIFSHVTVDGEYEAGKKAKVTYEPEVAGSYMLRFGAPITIKNLNFVGAKMLFVDDTAGNDNTTLENFTATVGSESLVDSMSYGSVLSINIVNSVIHKEKGNTHMIFRTMSNAQGGVGNITFNIKNSSITQNGGHEWPYSAIIHHDAVGKLIVNLTGNTELTYNAGGSANQGTMFMLWQGEAEFNIGNETDNGSGVKLNLGPRDGDTVSETLKYPSFFRRAARLVINDKGAEWNVHESFSLENGGFTFIHKDGFEGLVEPILAKEVLAITDGEKLYSPINTYLDGGKTYKTVGNTTEKPIENSTGAAIRLDGTGALRFHAKVNATLYEKFKTNGKYGIKVTTTAAIEKAGGDILAAEAVENVEVKWETESKVLVADVKNITDDDYGTVYVFVSYMTMYFDGVEGATFWSGYSIKNHARSFSQVAKSALADRKYSYTDDAYSYLTSISSR